MTIEEQTQDEAYMRRYIELGMLAVRFRMQVHIRRNMPFFVKMIIHHGK
jgi:hypothetical protein